MRASNLGEALTEAGFDQFEHQAQTVASNFIKSGGTREKWLAVYDAATGMSGMGLRHRADDSQTIVAQTRQQVEGNGRVASAGQESASARLSSPSFNRGGERQGQNAGNGRISVALPVREPTQQQRAASATAANVMAITIMDTLKIDGRSIGNWTVGEARNAGHRKTREGYILIEASRVVANANGSELLRHVVKPKELQKIIQKAAEVADAI